MSDEEGEGAPWSEKGDREGGRGGGREGGREGETDKSEDAEGIDSNSDCRKNRRD